MAQRNDSYDPSKRFVDRYINRLEVQSRQDEEGEMSRARSEVDAFIAELEGSIGAELDNWILYKREAATASRDRSLRKKQVMEKFERDGWQIVYDGPDPGSVNTDKLFPPSAKLEMVIVAGRKLIFKKDV